MNIKHIPAQREKFEVRIRRYDGKDWTDPVAFNARLKPYINEWLKAHAPGATYRLDFNGSGNGCCDPEDDDCVFTFFNEYEAQDFVSFFNSNYGVNNG